MKKIISFLVVLMMTVSLFAVAASAKDITIGVSIWSSTDTLGSEVKRLLDSAAETLGVKVIYVDQGHISEQVTASAETLAMAGCDGMIICNSSSAEMASVINTCNDTQMYLAQFFRVIDPVANPTEYEMAKTSPYYVGCVHESEVDNGKWIVKILADKGCRLIGVMGWQPGDATFLGRLAGYQAGTEEWNTAHPDDKITLLEPQYGLTTSDTGRATAEAIVTANPGIDALIVAGGGGDPLIGAMAAIENLGLTGQIQVASTDFLPNLDELLTSGAMSVESGGHYADPFFAFLMVYNAITGKYPVATDGFYEMIFPYMFVASPDDFASYAEYFTGTELPYYPDEIKALAESSYEDLAKACADLSVQDVVARHTK